MDVLPTELALTIAKCDSQVWRGMRRTDTSTHRLLTWERYVDTFTTVNRAVNSTAYYLDGLRHRENDLPSLVNGPSVSGEWMINGCDSNLFWMNSPVLRWTNLRVWHRRGLAHRVDKPAVIGGNTDGLGFYRYWCRDGVLDRKNGPAVIREHGSIVIEWQRRGRLRRKGNRPVRIIASKGVVERLVDGQIVTQSM
jgi:hypothetical protein